MQYERKHWEKYLVKMQGGIIVMLNKIESFFSVYQWGQDLYNCCCTHPSVSSLYDKSKKLFCM